MDAWNGQNISNKLQCKSYSLFYIVTKITDRECNLLYRNWLYQHLNMKDIMHQIIFSFK